MILIKYGLKAQVQNGLVLFVASINEYEETEEKIGRIVYKGI